MLTVKLRGAAVGLAVDRIGAAGSYPIATRVRRADFDSLLASWAGPRHCSTSGGSHWCRPSSAGAQVFGGDNRFQSAPMTADPVPGIGASGDRGAPSSSAARRAGGSAIGRATMRHQNRMLRFEFNERTAARRTAPAQRRHCSRVASKRKWPAKCGPLVRTGDDPADEGAISHCHAHASQLCTWNQFAALDQRRRSIGSPGCP